MAVIDELKEHGVAEILYIGSSDGPEKRMVEKAAIRFEAVKCGKLRRYFSFQNFVDFFKVPVGFFQARKILKTFAPDKIFSKGGYVSLPVVMAGKSLGIKTFVHESDVSVGLANRLCFRFADKILLSFEESRSYLPAKIADKAFVAGNPVRKSLSLGDKEQGRRFLGFDKHRPILLVMGGSQGARQINELVFACIDQLLKKFQVVHVVGRGNINIGMYRHHYVQCEYLDEQMADVYGACDVVVSRGGANSLAELAFLNKKVLVIPLEGSGSRGEQGLNARLFARKYGWSVLAGEISAEQFIEGVELAHDNTLPKIKFENGLKKIVDLLMKN